MYRAIFLGPSAGVEGAKETKGKGVRKCNAAIAGISEVTLPSIAYIATLVRILTYPPLFHANVLFTLHYL